MTTNLDPLTLWLRDSTGTSTRIGLGHDEKSVAWVARVEFGKSERRIDLERDIPHDQPIRLALRSAAGPMEGARTVTMTINEKDIGHTEIAGRVQNLKLLARNPKGVLERWFVAIYQLDVRWVGLKGDKR